MSKFTVLKQSFLQRWSKSSERSRLALKNIILSLGLKGWNIIVSIVMIPMTINYLDPTQYGIWLTISSIVTWAQFFDLGLANGFKNKFAEAKAKGDIQLAREYVSTTYCTLAIITTVIMGVICLLNLGINWSDFLNVSAEYQPILQKVFAILIIIFCMNMVANVFNKLAEADQRPAIASVIGSIGQILSLLSIFILTKVSSGSLIKLATYVSSIPLVTMIVASMILFRFSSYKTYRPSIKLFRPKLIKSILNLGIQFFLIYLCILVVFQLMNIILTREVGPIAVTEYQVAHRYFSVLYMISVIVVTPMWAAFTDAYTREDYGWMKSTIQKLEKFLLLMGVTLVICCLLSPWVFHIWIGDSVHVPILLSVAVAIFIFSQIGTAIFTQVMCGLGHMRIQFLIYLGFAIISFPIMTYCCRWLGAPGIVIVPTLVYLCQTVICRIQVWKVINKKATGIWLK